MLNERDLINSTNPRRSKEYWEIIKEYKNKLVKNNIKNPATFPLLNYDVAESWIRSYNLKINPFATKIIKKPVSKREYYRRLQKYEELIEVTRPLIDIFKDPSISRDYILELIDPDGITILQEGNLTSIHPFTGIDIIYTESTMGTNAHTLSMRSKRPVQLLGPEHYSEVFNNIIASAAPITNSNDEVVASLVLTQPFVVSPWDETIQRLLSHTLGLITAMSKAITAQLKLQNTNRELQQSNDQLIRAYNIIDATLGCVDEGIITIDQEGKIIRINQEGLRILKIKIEDLGIRYIQEFLDKRSRLMDYVQTGESVKNIEESIFAGGEEQTYLIDLRPVINLKNRKLDVAVLRLNHVEKINSLVTSRVGATAKLTFSDIIGESQQLRKAIEKARRFASTSANVLLIGESGTGKEIFAQAIHNEYRPQGPFVAVNCGAMPRELIESELFGYEAGSFTGAVRSGRPGKIELAHGGTLFLDEIGDMPFELQSVLLRVLEDKQVMRIGGRKYKKVDFKLISATNRNLEELIKEKVFREDLYYRLSVLSVKLPPLRSRRQDIENLCEHFIKMYCRKIRCEEPKLTEEAKKILFAYDWPGNVRQLENAIIYAINTKSGNKIEPEDLPENILFGKENSTLRKLNVLNPGADYCEALSLKNLEKEAIDLALRYTRNSIPKAAELLEISKATLYRKLKEYNI
ncbi:MAG: sigma-54 interaction domain-containing protein [Desulfitobacteriia bacterium]|jgi:transcriptional regulator with PAS, ATPase and Fis domain